MSAPVFDKYLRAPAKWWADDNPWIVRFGIMGAECSCCGAGLRRHAIEDAEGNVWGVDCWRTATGECRREAKKKEEGPAFMRRTRREGWVVWANGRAHTFPDAIPADLLDQLDRQTQKRHARLTGSATAP